MPFSCLIHELYINKLMEILPFSSWSPFKSAASEHASVAAASFRVRSLVGLPCRITNARLPSRLSSSVAWEPTTVGLHGLDAGLWSVSAAYKHA